MTAAKMIMADIRKYLCNGCLSYSWYLEGNEREMKDLCKRVKKALKRKKLSSQNLTCIRSLRWPADAQVLQLGKASRDSASCYLLRLEIGTKQSISYGRIKK